MSKSSNGSSGIGFFGLMFLVFMTLKLTGLIDWSWWWVTAPLWGPAIAAVVFIVVMLALAIYAEAKKR